jgi:sterol desaturase/sphingolipid hydroxylase (fatty acid hydroxylase superfamily)
MIALYIVVGSVLLLSGAVMHLLAWYYATPGGQALHIRDSKSRPVTQEQVRRYARINTPLSLVMILGPVLLAGGHLFHAGSAPWWRVLFEALGVLLLYDFTYYLAHRYPFHEWKLLRHVHAVHHTIKAPMALDSLYQHPVENLIGISLFWLSTATVALIGGPLSVYGFGISFLVFSFVNVVIHSGLRFKRFPFSLLTYLGVRHYKHHRSMKAKNYGSVSPLFDLLFGTEES